MVSYLNLSESTAANSVKLSSLHFETSLMTVISPVSQAVRDHISDGMEWLVRTFSCSILYL